MKRVMLYLTIGVIFGFISYFLLQELSPFDSQKLEELIQTKEIEEGDFESLNNEIEELIKRGLVFSYLSENAYIVALCILASIFSIFVAIHLIVDKIFFKNFYENASQFDALRRGLFLVSAIGLFVFSKLSRVEDYVLVLIVIIPLLVEMVYIMYFKKKDSDLEENVAQEKNINTEQQGRHISFEEAFEDLGRFKNNPDK